MRRGFTRGTSGMHVGRYPGLLWFRVCGVGLHAKDTRRRRLLFSERRGLRPGVYIGRWRVKPLYRRDICA